MTEAVEVPSPPDELPVDLGRSHELKPHPKIPRATKPLLICVSGTMVVKMWGFSSPVVARIMQASHEHGGALSCCLFVDQGLSNP